jgi:hypothetical protein
MCILSPEAEKERAQRWRQVWEDTFTSEVGCGREAGQHRALSQLATTTFDYTRDYYRLTSTCLCSSQHTSSEHHCIFSRHVFLWRDVHVCIRLLPFDTCSLTTFLVRVPNLARIHTQVHVCHVSVDSFWISYIFLCIITASPSVSKFMLPAARLLIMALIKAIDTFGWLFGFRIKNLVFHDK